VCEVSRENIENAEYRKCAKKPWQLGKRSGPCRGAHVELAAPETLAKSLTCSWLFGHHALALWTVFHVSRFKGSWLILNLA